MMSTTNAPQESTECIAVAYESTSDYATFVWADKDKYAYSRQWDGSDWDPASTQINLDGLTTVDMWLSLKANPSSDNLMLLDIDGANDLNTVYLDGSSWSATNTVSASGKKHNWVQLDRSINNGSKVLGVALNDSKNLGGLSWNGATLTNLGDDLFTSDTATTTYECFDIQFQKH